MAENSENENEIAKAPRERSPSFPFIPLKGAIARLQEFEDKFGRQPPPADKVYLAWGFKGDTSQAQQTVGALKAFGLVNYQGTGLKRPVSISEDGRTYLRANQDAIKKEILRKLALKPAFISRIWQKWGNDRHPDEVCLDELVFEHKVNEKTAPRFLTVYDQTIAFAGLSKSDKVHNADDDEGSELDFAVGDLINWENSGIIQWKEPRKIVSVDEHEDGQKLYKVEGQGELADQIGWIPVEQAIQPQPKIPPPAGGHFAPPPADPQNAEIQVKDGSRKAVFPVEDGDVTLIFPEAITGAGLDELGEYLKIFLKKEQKKKDAE